MTAQTKARSVIEHEGVFSRAPVKGSTTIHQGALVVTENGLAIPGKTGTALTVLGVAVKTVVNGGSDGDETVDTKRGVFDFDNLGADAVVAGDVGKDCYIVDDQTVAKTHATNTRSVAGKVISLEGGRVFVRVGY